MILSDTIVAPATPHGFGGISVVRLSGPRSKHIVLELSKQNTFKPNLVVFTDLYDKNNLPFEQGVVTYFQAPASYTGEDVFEISCHGNPLVVQKIVDLCILLGSRLANPGEFTLRAFLNGKIDLVQAESVSGLIHGQSTEAASLNYHILRGGLSKKFSSVKRYLVDILSTIEYYLDVTEDEITDKETVRLSSKLTTVSNDLFRLLDTYQVGKLLTDGAAVVLVGEPNVGKSTLLNALTESDRVITSPRPGTTRDSVECRLVVEGIPIRLIDTAGIRPSKDDVESEGVRRTHAEILKADLALYIISPEAPFSQNIFDSISSPNIIIHNKTDLQDAQKNSSDIYSVSAKTGEGIDNLRVVIKNHLTSSSKTTELVALTTARQYDAVKQCCDSSSTALSFLNPRSVELELCAFELQNALSSLNTVLGKTTPDDILNNIFGHFCIGK